MVKISCYKLWKPFRTDGLSLQSSLPSNLSSFPSKIDNFKYSIPIFNAVCRQDAFSLGFKQETGRLAYLRINIITIIF